MTGSAEDGVVVLNPVSGSGDHAEAVRNRARLQGYEVRETEAAGDAVDLAAAAAEEGVPLVAAAGGDGTLNEVIRGVDRADALEDVAVGVIPVGTGNDFAGNVGITDVDHAFRVLAEGERRRLDLGEANGTPFVNNCVGGLTADASSRTTPELKSRLGVLAYVVTTLQTLAEYEGIRLSVGVRDVEGAPPSWSGEAVVVLVGNGRRFATEGRTQANMEDGLLDIALLEESTALDLVEDAVLERVFHEESPDFVRGRGGVVEVEVVDDEPMTFSLDGEMIEERRLRLSVREGALRIPVPDGYVPEPDYE
jgi:YegS/Rv2252/BmrU family lipid kinase